VGIGERVGGGERVSVGVVASCGTGVCSGTKSDDGSSCVGSTFRSSIGSCMSYSGSGWSAMLLTSLRYVLCSSVLCGVVCSGMLRGGVLCSVGV
jgi:hypothetical protein